MMQMVHVILFQKLSCKSYVSQSDNVMIIVSSTGLLDHLSVYW